MKKLLLVLALLFSGFTQADTLTVDAQGLATFTASVPAVNASYTSRRIFTVYCPSTLNGISVTAYSTNTALTNVPSEWLSSTVHALGAATPVATAYRDKPILLSATTNSITNASVSDFVINRYGLITHSNPATVQSVIGCYAGSTIIPIVLGPFVYDPNDTVGHITIFN